MRLGMIVLVHSLIPRVCGEEPGNEAGYEAQPCAKPQPHSHEQSWGAKPKELDGAAK